LQVALLNTANSEISSRVFDLANGELGEELSTANPLVSSKITGIGAGWYRCEIVAQLNSTPSHVQFTIANSATGNATTLNQVEYTGDGTGTIYLWGAQLEAGAFPTSYIATSGSQATRAADIASMTGTNFSEWYRQDEGSVVVSGQIADTGGSTRRWASVNDGTVNNSIQAAIGFTGLTAYLEVRSNITVQAAFTNGSFTAGAEVKTGIAYKVNDFAISANGVSAGTDTDGLVPVVDRLSIGTHAAGASAINGHIKRLAYYPARLTNAQLQALTEG